MRPHPLVATAWLTPAVPALALAILIAADGSATAIGIAAFGLGFALRNAISIQQAHSAHNRAETAPPTETRPNRKPQRPRRAARTMNIFTAIGRTVAGIVHAPEPPDLERLRCATALNDLPTAHGNHRQAGQPTTYGCRQAGHATSFPPPRKTPPPPRQDETNNADSDTTPTGYRLLGSILSELLNAELLADDIAGRNRHTELRQQARQQQAVLNDQTLLDQAFEQHIATLSNGERPAGWANTHQAYREFQARLKQQLADTEAELAQPEPAPTSNDTAYLRVRDAVLRILDETAATGGALPAAATAETAELEPALATPASAPPGPAVAAEPDQEPEEPTVNTGQPAADRTFTEPPNPLTESWIPLPEFHRLNATMLQPPTAIHFPDQAPVALANWSEIITSTANYLIDQGKIKAADCPIVIPPGQLPTITTDAKRDSRNKLRTLPLHEGLHIANRHNRSTAAQRAIRLLRYCDVDPDQCQLMVLTADLPQPD